MGDHSLPIPKRLNLSHLEHTKVNKWPSTLSANGCQSIAIVNCLTQACVQHMFCGLLGWDAATTVIDFIDVMMALG